MNNRCVERVLIGPRNVTSFAFLRDWRARLFAPATAATARLRWSGAIASRLNQLLDVTQATSALRIVAFAVVQSFGALCFDVL